jgi:tetratricopeptide (TPR) repeat protein
MKKTVMIFLSVMLLVVNILPAQENSPDQAYIKAVTTQDPGQKASLLKDWIAKYSGQGSQYENFAYATLVITPYPGKTPQETITYGEKAIQLGGLDEMTVCQVCLTLSTLISQSGQNMDKAKSYAEKVVQTAQAAKGKESERENAKQWNTLIGAGHYAGGQAMEKAGDLKGASKAYIDSFKILKNPQILANIKTVGKALYDAKQYAAAETPFRLACQESPDFGSLAILAKTLYRLGKKDDALNFFKQAHGKQKTGEIAYNIGILLAGKAGSSAKAANEAIDYLLQASFLSQANSKKAMDLAQGLFFNTARKDLQYNEKVKLIRDTGKTLQQKTDTFNTTFGEKAEEDLTDKEKREMEVLLAEIQELQKNIKIFEEESQAALGEFNKLIEQTKKNLGISG